MDKRSELYALAKKRQAADLSKYSWDKDKPVRQIGSDEYHDGYYECDHVSPYTKTAGNYDSPIMIMLQDWSSDEFLRGEVDPFCKEHGYTENLPTNKTLKKLLKEYFAKSLEQVYGTNLFPFIKHGDMGTGIPQTILVRAAKEFAIPQIKIVGPKLVICLGLATFNALRVASDIKPIRPMKEAIKNPFDLDGVRIWCQAHTGARGQNNRGRDQVNDDWKKMSNELEIGK